jgi:hypothetical protein
MSTSLMVDTFSVPSFRNLLCAVNCALTIYAGWSAGSQRACRRTLGRSHLSSSVAQTSRCQAGWMANYEIRSAWRLAARPTSRTAKFSTASAWRTRAPGRNPCCLRARERKTRPLPTRSTWKGLPHPTRSTRCPRAHFRRTPITERHPSVCYTTIGQATQCCGAPWRGRRSQWAGDQAPLRRRGGLRQVPARVASCRRCEE